MLLDITVIKPNQCRSIKQSYRVILLFLFLKTDLSEQVSHLSLTIFSGLWHFHQSTIWPFTFLRTSELMRPRSTTLAWRASSRRRIARASSTASTRLDPWCKITKILSKRTESHTGLPSKWCLHLCYSYFINRWRINYMFYLPELALSIVLRTLLCKLFVTYTTIQNLCGWNTLLISHVSYELFHKKWVCYNKSAIPL